MNEWEEKELLAGSRRGSPALRRRAYGQLVRAYSARVFAICLAMLGNRADAEDAAQQAFLKGFENIKSLGGEARFGAWICRIAKNLCVDLIRSRGRQRRVLGKLAAEQVRSGGRDSAGFDELEAALARLPEEYRLPLVLYYFDGRSAKGVAEAFEISEAAVYTRMCRARSMLREILRGRAGNE